MLIGKREYFEEVYVLLRQDVDFTEDDITYVGLPSIKAEKATQLAIEYGYQSWSWLGDYDKKTGTVTAKFRRPLFVEEKSESEAVFTAAIR